MVSWKKMFFYGMTLVSLNLLSCNKESSTEAEEQIDYLKPLIGTWRMLEQDGYNLEDYIIRTTFSDEPGYGGAYYFSYNDTANNNYCSHKSKIENITAEKYKLSITHASGKRPCGSIGEVLEYNYYILDNRLYEDDGYLYNVYRKE